MKHCLPRGKRTDFLVGADGVRSVVRAQLLDDVAPRYAGYTCWRGVATLVQTALAEGTAFECWGRGRRFAIFHCGQGSLFWWATQNCPFNAAENVGGRKAAVQELFAKWHEPIPSVIAATAEILRNDIIDRPPDREWGRGRITLLGDAAHATTPNLGQGACQAMEDAVVLSDQLRRCTTVEGALRGYEKLRQRRTARITNESFRLGRICQWENPVACWLRNGLTQFTPPLLSLRYLEQSFRQELPEI